MGLDCESKDRDCVGACLASQNMVEYKDACIYIYMCICLHLMDFKCFTCFRFFLIFKH